MSWFKFPACGTDHQHPVEFEPDFDPLIEVEDYSGFDAPDGMWETEEGDYIPYEELGDQHLLNILAMLGRSCSHYHGLEELEAEAAKRGLGGK